MKFAVIVTNYNSTSFSAKLIENLTTFDCEIDIYIVDNCSNGTELDKLKELSDNFSSVVVEALDKNIGYFAGLNIGLRLAMEAGKTYDFFLVGNNDVTFADDFFIQLENQKERLDEEVIVSPRITTNDGVEQNPHVIKRISKKREFIYDLYYLNFFLAKLIRLAAAATHKYSDRKDEQSFAQSQHIYQGYGALYVLTPRFFSEFGLFWAPSFMMYEEFFLAYQINEKGFRVFYEPSLQVHHACNGSISTITSRAKWQLARDSHKLYRKYIKVWS